MSTDASLRRPKYVHPFTDYGFKRLFGETLNKELLMDLINEILKDETGIIEDITYMNTERLGPTELDRGAVFDIYCKNQAGEYFIVELQKAKQNYFKERSVYYATFPIQEQAQRGNWNFKLKAVYTIGILDFVFDEHKDNPNVMSKVKLCDLKTNDVFYDKLTFIYLEMPKFNKTEAELESRFDQWLYVFRNLQRLQKRPKKLQERIFNRLFESAEIAKFNTEDLSKYEASLKHYRDVKNVIDTAWDEGEAIGLEKGREEGEVIGLEKGREEGEAIGAKKEQQKTVMRMHEKGMKVEEISDILVLPKAEVDAILHS